MALSRFANARDANEKPIVDALIGIGATVERLDKPVDLLVGYRGRNLLLEVKRPAGPRGGTHGRNLTPEQVEFFRTWRGQRCVVRNVNEALQAIGAVSAIVGRDCR